MKEATKQHIMSLEDPDLLRQHMLSQHTFSMPSAVLVRNANHHELDDYHITAHRADQSQFGPDHL